MEKREIVDVALDTIEWFLTLDKSRRSESDPLHDEDAHCLLAARDLRITFRLPCIPVDFTAHNAQASDVIKRDALTQAVAQACLRADAATLVRRSRELARQLGALALNAETASSATPTFVRSAIELTESAAAVERSAVAAQHEVCARFLGVKTWPDGVRRAGFSYVGDDGVTTTVNAIVDPFDELRLNHDGVIAGREVLFRRSQAHQGICGIEARPR